MLLNPKKIQQANEGSVNSPEQIDPFDAPVPGQSLTDEPGKWPWDAPPKMVDPDDAVDFVIGRIEDDQDTKDDIDKFLMSGTPVESIVNTIAFTGFAEGLWNPDVAEIIKFPLSAYFATMAIDRGYPLVMYNDNDPKQDVSDQQIIDSLRENYPEVVAEMTEMLEQPMEPQGFLEEEPMMLEDLSMLEGEEGLPEEGMMVITTDEEGMI